MMENRIRGWTYLLLTLLIAACGCHTVRYHSGSNNVRLFKEYCRMPMDLGANGKLQVLKIVKMHDGLKMPILLKPTPTFGIMRVYERIAPEDVIQYLGPGQEYMTFPVSPSIEVYYLFIRRLGPPSEEWRMMEVLPSQIRQLQARSERMPLPDIEQLPMLASIVDSQRYLDLMAEGESERRKLGEQDR